MFDFVAFFTVVGSFFGNLFGQLVGGLVNIFNVWL